MNHLKTIWSAVFGVAVWLFWWLLYPQVLNYHEQYQLFLFTDSYLLERLAVAGGLADWLSEFAVQFFYVKWLGALLLALIFVAFQRLTWAAGKRCSGNTEDSNDVWYFLSFVPALLLLVYMGNPDVLVSLIVALIIGLLMCLLYKKVYSRIEFSLDLEKIQIDTLFVDFLIICALYWLAGPLPVYIFVCYAFFINIGHSGFGPASLLHLLQDVMLTMICIKVLAKLFLTQYPQTDIWFGINYFRLPAMLPALQLIVPVVLISCIGLLHFLPAKSRQVKTDKRTSHEAIVNNIAISALMLCTYTLTPLTFVQDNMEQLAFDWHIRNEQWNKVVKLAEKHQPRTEFSATAVNLSLFMTGQMDKRINEFYQCGVNGLLAPRYRDLLTDMPTTEAYWRLGFVNSTFRFMFDMQEATGNNRKSGRCTQRMIDALIVNGWYEVAGKYIDRLEHTIFYRKWAAEAKTYLWNEEKVLSNPVYAYLRSVRFEEDFLFYHPEMDKMLGKLYLHNKNNIMAAYYYQAWQLLERGNAQ